MKPITKRKAHDKASNGVDPIACYDKAQAAEHAAICQTLRAEIDEALPKAIAKIWHGSPVWFLGENPVVGYNVTSKKGVNLLFWNGQSFGEPALQPAGKVRAAQIQFTDVSQIDPKALRRWLKSAGTDIWNYHGYFRSQRTLQMKRITTARLTPIVVTGAMFLVAASLCAQSNLQQVLKDTAVSAHWIYDDFTKGVAEAKATGKPLLVTLRCVP